MLLQPEVYKRVRCSFGLPNSGFFILVCVLFLFKIKSVTKCSWKHANNNYIFCPTKIILYSHSINIGLFSNICLAFWQNLKLVPKKIITMELESKLNKRVGWKKKKKEWVSFLRTDYTLERKREKRIFKGSFMYHYQFNKKRNLAAQWDGIMRLAKYKLKHSLLGEVSRL